MPFGSDIVPVLPIALIAAAASLAVLRVLASAYEQGLATHDLRIRTARLRRSYAQRLEAAAKSGSGRHAAELSAGESPAQTATAA